MSTLRIEGGRRLSGRVAVEGNKNSALPLMAACLLTDETCVLTNVPRIRDVAVLADLLTGLGATVEGVGHVHAADPLRDGHERRPDAGAGRQAARIGAAARAAAGAARLGAAGARPAAISRRAARSAPTSRRSWRSARRCATSPATCSTRRTALTRRLLLSRRGVGDRNRDRAPRGRLRHADRPRSATPRWSRTSPSCAGSCARWARRSRARARRRSAWKARRGCTARATGSTATTSRPAAGASSPRSPAATSR